MTKTRCFLALTLALAAAAAVHAEDVVWSRPVNVVASPVALTRGAGSGWTAGASSVQALVEGDGALDFGTGETTTDKVCGLGHNSESQAFEEIDFAIRLEASGIATVIERGVAKLTAGAYLVTDRFRVAVEGTQIVYRKNGAVLYTSSVVPTYPLLADASLFTTGASLTQVQISGSLAENVIWTSGQNVAPRGHDVVKSGGLHGQWDARAISSRGIAAGDAYFEFVAPETNRMVMAGLSRGGSTIPQVDVDYALCFLGDGKIYVRERGSQYGPLGTFTAGDRFRVAIESGQIVYSRNGSPLRQSAAAVTYPLVPAVSLGLRGRHWESRDRRSRDADPERAIGAL
jgi:hypothetical protein